MVSRLSAAVVLWPLAKVMDALCLAMMEDVLVAGGATLVFGLSQALMATWATAFWFTCLVGMI